MAFHAGPPLIFLREHGAQSLRPGPEIRKHSLIKGKSQQPKTKLKSKIGIGSVALTLPRRGGRVLHSPPSPRFCHGRCSSLGGGASSLPARFFHQSVKFTARGLQ